MRVAKQLPSLKNMSYKKRLKKLNANTEIQKNQG